MKEPIDSQLGSELLLLVEQSRWANRVWIDFVYGQREPEVRPRELLSHIMLSERVWYDRVSGTPTVKDIFVVLGKPELLTGFEENRKTFQSLIVSRQDEVIHFTRLNGDKYHCRVLDIIHHLITHGYHHRGQLAAHYARAKVEYPSTDHIDYLILNEL